MENNLLFIDTETGGMDPEKHSLLSVAFVVWNKKEIITSKEWLINDGILSFTEEALSINKIDLEEHQKTAMSPAMAIESMIAFMKKHFPEKQKIVVAGHNVHFDVGFLKKLFSQNNKELSQYISHRIVDTSSILYYLHFTGQLKEKAVSSNAAFQLFNIEVDGRHTALGDAIATAELFNKLIDIAT